MKDLKRLEKIKELIKKHKNFEIVAKEIGVSRQRIEQIIKPFKEELREYIGKNKRFKKPKDFTTIKCKYCGKTKISKYRYYTPMFCSKECLKNFWK